MSTEKEQNEELDSSTNSPQSVVKTDEIPLPYNLILMKAAVPRSSKWASRYRVCEKARSKKFVCHPFYKPISRPFDA